MAASAANATVIKPLPNEAKLNGSIMVHQIVDASRMNIDAGDRAAPELRGRRLDRQRAARRACRFGAGRKALRRDLAILDIEQRSEQHDLAVEIATKIFRVALFGTGVQIREGERSNVVAAAGEVERQRVGHRARNPVAAEVHRAVGSQFRRLAERTRCQFRGHRWHRAAADREGQRQPSDHVVRVVVDVERTDVALLADRYPLSG